MLVTVTARLVRSHGAGDEATLSAGTITYTPQSTGVHEGALRGREAVFARVVDGVAEEVELTPGPWTVTVRPEGDYSWPPWTVELVEGMPEPVDLADLAPVVVVDGEKWSRGKPGHSPVFTWEGSRLAVDGIPGPDLTGPQGPEADTTAALAAYILEVQ